MASVLRPDPDVLPAWPVDPCRDAHLGPARGVCYSLLFAGLLWSMVAAVTWTVVG